MTQDETLARCSVCGREGPRDDMFGAEPDLLCEACSNRVRQRMAPSPVGRLVVPTFAQSTAPLTYLFLGIAVALYLLGEKRTYPLLAMTTPAGGGYSYLTVIWQPWRLLTSAFLHMGFLHIFFNAWWIWELGKVLEMRRGSIAYAILFLGSATMGGACAWLFEGPAVGLSGAVYGLAAYFFATRKHDPVAAAVMTPNLTRFLIAWLVLGVILSQTHTLGISNWGHGGGALFGLLMGFGVGSRLKWVLWPLLAGSLAALVFLVTTGTRFWGA